MLKRGFIALTSAILLCALLLCIIASASLLGMTARSAILDRELKARSRATAQACANMALLSLTQQQSYDGNTTITLNEIDSCTIGAIAGAETTVEGSAGRAVTALLVTLSTTTSPQVSWQEITPH